MTKKFIFIIFIKIKFAFSINDHQLTENRLTKKYLDNFNVSNEKFYLKHIFQLLSKL